MYMPGTEMHMVTFSIVLFELVILFFQLIYFLERPQEKSRMWYLILLFLLIQYNVLGGLLPDERIPISIPLQNILAYGSAIVMSMYFLYYLYKVVALEGLRWIVTHGMFYFVLIPFITGFIIPYELTGDLELSRKLLVIVPFFFCIFVGFYITRSVKKKYQEALQNGSEKAYREKIISVYLAFTFWLSLPVITYFDGGQVWEVTMTNAGFLVMTIAYIRSSVLNAQAEHQQLLVSKQELQKLNRDLQHKVEERTRKLEQMNDQKTHTLINLIHETKTPLTLISNYLEEYINSYGLNQELAVIKYNTDKLAQDVTNLFDLQRLEKGIDIYDHDQVTNFTQLIENALTLFRPLAKHKEIRLYSARIDHVSLKAAPEAITRVINNLLENSIKYTDRGGEVRVSLQKHHDSLQFLVTDTGIGIPDHLQQKIFEPYFQIGHHKKNNQGLGMGMSIVKKTVDSLQGSLHIESSQEIGTTIKVSLPIVLTEVQQSPAVPSATPLKLHLTTQVPEDSLCHPEAPYVLIVEDNLHMLNYLNNKLKVHYNIYAAENGAKALEKLEHIAQLDLIISDVMMDVLDGYEFISVLMKQKKFHHVPFIFLTAKSAKTDWTEAISLGAIDFIEKPFSIDSLRHKVDAILNNMERQRKAIINNAYQILNPHISPHTLLIADSEVLVENYRKFQLTVREIEVVQLLMQGKTYTVIGESLHISGRTVSKHVQNIFAKTATNNKIDLMNALKTS